MKDFSKEFEKDRDEFDKEFKRMRKMQTIFMYIYGFVALSAFVFFMWVIVMVMRYFGIV